jgi:hypothetical protein
MYSLCGAKLLQKWIDSAAAKGYTMKYKKTLFFIFHMIYV